MAAMVSRSPCRQPQHRINDQHLLSCATTYTVSRYLLEECRAHVYEGDAGSTDHDHTSGPPADTPDPAGSEDGA